LPVFQITLRNEGQKLVIVSTPLKISSDRDAPTKNPTNPPLRILLVEDDKLIGELYAVVLTGAGYRVDIAEDGEVGWHMLRAVSYSLESYHVMITDNNMPKLSGVELIKKLRSEHMTLPVIMATAVAPLDTADLRLAAILTKPFPLEQLVQTVDEVLGTAR
jgi:DNA-binding response OmpR family regulator